jgi:hypothetical protein
MKYWSLRPIIFLVTYTGYPILSIAGVVIIFFGQMIITMAAFGRSVEVANVGFVALLSQNLVSGRLAALEKRDRLVWVGFTPTHL